MDLKIVAADLGDEIDVKALINDKGYPQPTLRWEEPVRFKHQNGEIFVYRFGAVAGVNVEMTEFLPVLESLDEYVLGRVKHGDVEELDLCEGPSTKIEEDRLHVPELSDEVVEVVAFALAQSVALSRMERLTDELDDEIEKVINGRRIFRRKRALDTAIKILGLKHEILSDIMILEKPSITWESEFLDDLYERLILNYEIKRRYRVVETKLNHAFEATSVLLNIANEARSNFLEFLIVVLIALEIVLWLFELFR